MPLLQPWSAHGGTYQSLCLRRVEAAAFDQIVVADDLSADKAPLKIRVDLAFSDLEVLERRYSRVKKLANNDKTAAKEAELIRNSDNADIRIDCTERIICRLCPCFGQRIEQGALSHIRETECKIKTLTGIYGRLEISVNACFIVFQRRNREK